MKRTWRIFFLIIFLTGVTVRPASAQSGLEPIIQTPKAGDVIQGTLSISGSSNSTGFVSSDVAFAYSGDTTGTWFLIATSIQPVEDGTLATWDTTTITDGNYILRLRVYLSDGSTHDVIVQDVRVRNYTAIETPTPAPTPLRATPVPTATLTATPFPTPTPMSPNQAILTPVDLSMSIGYGGLAAITLLIVVGIYLWLRRK